MSEKHIRSEKKPECLFIVGFSKKQITVFLWQEGEKVLKQFLMK
jgi:hypothetical protein